VHVRTLRGAQARLAYARRVAPARAAEARASVAVIDVTADLTR